MRLVLHHSIDQIMKERGLNLDGVVQRYIDTQTIKECAPYTPFRTGMLRGSATVVNGGGAIEYKAPYARRLYYNKGGVDSLGRRYSPVRNFNMRANCGSRRGSMWFERMKRDGGADKILRGAAKMAGTRYSR